MVAAVADLGAKPAVRADRDVRCPCGRFLTQVWTFAALPSDTVWARVKCPGCGRWQWIDTATGRVTDRPKPPVTGP